MESGKKLKFSNWHLTVNFNVDSEDHIGQMREAVEEMVEDPWLWRWLKQYNHGQQVDFREATKPLVDRVRVRAAFEHGGAQNHGLHVHLVVEVAHDTLVQVNKLGLVQLFEHFVHLNPNIHIRFMPGRGEDKDFILHYISKEVSYCTAQSPLSIFASTWSSSRSLSVLPDSSALSAEPGESVTAACVSATRSGRSG